MSAQKVRENNRRTIESELHNYHETLKWLEAEKKNIIDSNPPPESCRKSEGPSDPTGSKGSRLSSPQIIEIERRIKAIDYAIEVFKAQEAPQKLEAIELKYFRRELTDYGISQKVHADVRTIRRWRRQFVAVVADRLGWQI